MKLSLIESRLFGRICYGFKRDKYGFVEIVPEQAEVVKTIFRMYREKKWNDERAPVSACKANWYSSFLPVCWNACVK